MDVSPAPGPAASGSLGPSIVSVDASVRAATPRLRANSLSRLDLLGASLATVAPAYSLYTTTALIVVAVGIGSPVVVAVAALAFLLHANTTAQFSRVMPSAGSYISFLGKTFGATTGATMSIVMLVGGIIGSAGLFIVPGWWTAISIQALFGVTVSWWIPFVILNAIFLGLVLIGVSLSTRVAASMFIIEVVILFAAAIVALALHPHAINTRAFLPSSVSGGLSGFGVAFPLALYMFLGASNNIPLADEAHEPRKSVPQTIYVAAIIAALLYVFFDWATSVGFGNHVAAIGAASFPLLDAVAAHFGELQFLLYLAGWTSTVGLLITNHNGAGRIAFSAAREGMLPRSWARVHPRWHTPWAAILVTSLPSLILAGIFGAAFGPANGFGYAVSIGTLSVILYFIAANIALPIFYWRECRAQASVVVHAILPAIGSLLLLFPLYALLQPGSPFPYNIFPYISMGIVAIGAVYGVFMTRRGKEMRPGSVLADTFADDDMLLEEAVR